MNSPQQKWGKILLEFRASIKWPTYDVSLETFFVSSSTYARMNNHARYRDRTVPFSLLSSSAFFVVDRWPDFQWPHVRFTSGASLFCAIRASR